jgi:hypothetical protein
MDQIPDFTKTCTIRVAISRRVRGGERFGNSGRSIDHCAFWRIRYIRPAQSGFSLVAMSA